MKKKKEAEEKEYYYNHFEEIMIQKIEDNEPLTENELGELVSSYDVETSYSENLRWCRGASTIVKLLDRYFRIDWFEGLTEMQENEYDSQPVEVFQHLSLVVSQNIVYTETEGTKDAEIFECSAKEALAKIQGVLKDSNYKVVQGEDGTIALIPVK